MVDFQFWPDVPAEIRLALGPLMHRWAYLLPGWCHWVRIYYEPSDDGSIKNTAEPEYRGVRLTVCADWLHGTAERRNELIVHEFLHVPLAPMVHLAKELIHSLVADEKTRDVLNEQWRLAFEGAVCDLERIVLGQEPLPPSNMVPV